MQTPSRIFTDSPAVRSKVPLLIGLVGPSGGGKTYSALRLATGMQRVTGGDIFGIDTESGRMLYYAHKFKFRHVPFAAPFGSLDYLAAIEQCHKKGAGVIIVDSMSHEHEGPGGLLEMHDSEVDRLSKGDPGRADKVKMLAWAKPKAARRRLINTILQTPCNIIFCFRAKEKMKMERGKEPVNLGWMPIAGEEFVYEMTANALLMPNAGGVPTWLGAEPGERIMIKLPEQFRDLLLGHGKQGENGEFQRWPLDANIGEAMSRWAAGVSGEYMRLDDKLRAATSNESLKSLEPELKKAVDDKLISNSESDALRSLYGTQRDSFGKPKAKPAPVVSTKEPEHVNPDADEIDPLDAAIFAFNEAGGIAEELAEASGSTLAKMRASKGDARIDWAKMFAAEAKLLTEANTK